MSPSSSHDSSLLRFCRDFQTAEQAAAEAERLEEQARQKREPQARAALAQAERLGAGGALQLEGHPTPAFNGMYRRVGQELHGGFPRYEHASSGRQLYRYQAYEEWFLDSDYSPEDTAVAGGKIASARGEVPLGAQTWQCYDGAKWEERKVTVRELVRAVAPLRLVLRCSSLYADSIRRWSLFVWR